MVLGRKGAGVILASKGGCGIGSKGVVLASKVGCGIR